MRPSYLEVDLQAISHNLKEIKKMVGEKVEVIPVIKANGYGAGGVHLQELLKKNEIKLAAIAIPEEGIDLREHGWNMPLLVLNAILEDQVKEVVDYQLTPGISVYEVAEALNQYAKQKKCIVPVHIEVDTGMGRVGLKPQETLSFIEKVRKLENIKIEGLYTHFSSADSSKEYTNRQMELFEKVIQEVKQKRNGYSFYSCIC